MKFISAIFRTYQRNLKYIGDFENISAQLKLYRRLLEYIDFPAKNDNYRKPYFQFYRRIT
ncbi:hypothetical protein LamDB_44080 [Bacillus anthracis]|uniref:Uncharacterized protein n=1 Tax=Bacillus anthracis TaxID=1392 RepID=A0A640L0J6_BACAN|nr:hypothetical protein BAN44_5112 [Bacillus anthracis]GAO67950.1 hypothetical protein BA5240_5200 [Bacillus anthracis]GET95312.1 hypothetical protein TuanDB_10710 [Bacillus anthracis]GEU02523.1 hypothetical protein DB1_41340 [Bacillus anthracis]GEU07775.1 hypothetical protein HG1_32600 [Bacillus anthracis]